MISDADLLAYIRPASEDDLPTLRMLERAAVAHIEKRTGRYFGVEAEITEVVQWRGWPMQLANTPVGAITSFESWDGTSFSAVDSSTYYIDGAVIWLNNTTWNASTSPRRYRVTYTAGYTDLGGDEWDAPEDVKQAVLLLVGHWFENRESVVVGVSASAVPMAVDALLDGHVRVAV